MSTKIYGFRISKADWWDFIATAKEFYAQNHPVSQLFAETADKINNFADDDERADRGAKSLLDGFKILETLYPKDDICVLKVFEIAGSYTFIPYERDYFFMNSAAEQNWPLSQIFYDTRSDMSREEKRKTNTVRALLAAEEKGRFWLYPLFTAHDIQTRFFKNLLRS